MLIYLGTLFYTLAAYLHLRLRPWTFGRALALAVPLVLLEYQFSLRGNHAAHSVLGLSAPQIMVLTICFYLANVLLLPTYSTSAGTSAGPSGGGSMRGAVAARPYMHYTCDDAARGSSGLP